MTSRALRLYMIYAAGLLLVVSSRVDAQYRPRRASGGGVGENYHLELGAVIWDTSADISLSNTALDLTGTTISLKNDLGVADQKFAGFDLILRPAAKHKFRVQLIPVH